MSAQSEVWRVSTVEGIFVAGLDTLKQWIDEGCGLPTDKVGEGTHSRIDARRAPRLRGAFTGEGGATVAVATTDASTQQSKTQLPWSEPAAEYSAVVDPVEVVGPAPADFSAAATAANTCHNHAEAQAK